MLRNTINRSLLDALGLPLGNIKWIDNGDFQQGLPESYYVVANNGSAPTVPSTDGFLVMPSGTNSAAQIAFGGEYFGHYNSGQAFIGIGSVMWEAGIASNVRKFGAFNPGCEYGIELNGTTWQVFHRTGAVQEYRTLTVTTAAGVNGNVTITLNGVAFTPAVTNSGVINTTAREIAAGTYTGWTATATGDVVTFIANWSGARSGSYSFAAGGTGAVATGPTQVRAGATWSNTSTIAMTAVNGDKMNGTMSSRLTIAENKLFVFACGHGYLGAANPTIAALGKGNNQWFPVHTFEHSGTANYVNLNPPSMYIGWQNINSGNTTDVSIRGASYVIGFSNGATTGRGRLTTNTSLRTLSTGSFLPLLGIRMATTKGGRVNWDEFSVDRITAFSTASTRTQFQVWLNPQTYTAGTVWTTPSKGAVEYDESGTAATLGTGEVVGEGYINNAGQCELTLVRQINIQAGDVLLVVSNGTGGANYTADATIAGLER